MAKGMEMFEGGARACGIIYDHRADIVVLELAAHGCGGNVVLLQIGEDVDVDEQPVGEDDQAFDAAVEQHFEIALEAAALVVHVGEDGTVAEVLGGFVDASFGGVGNVASERRVVQHDGNGGGGKSAALGDVADGN